MLREPTALGDDKVPLLHLKRKVILLVLPSSLRQNRKPYTLSVRDRSEPTGNILPS